MTKAVREMDVVFDEVEMGIIELKMEAEVLQRARQHFLDEGWTEEEISDRITFKKPEREYLFADFGTHMEHMMVGLRVPVEIKQNTGA